MWSRVPCKVLSLLCWGSSSDLVFIIQSMERIQSQDFKKNLNKGQKPQSCTRHKLVCILKTQPSSDTFQSRVPRGLALTPGQAWQFSLVHFRVYFRGADRKHSHVVHWSTIRRLPCWNIRNTLSLVTIPPAKLRSTSDFRSTLLHSILHCNFFARETRNPCCQVSRDPNFFHLQFQTKQHSMRSP